MRLFKSPAILISILLLSGSSIFSFVYFFSLQSKAFEELDNYSAKTDLPTIVYDNQGRVIGQFGHRRQQKVSIKHLPEQVIQPFLSAEDKDFFNHVGISLSGLMRAVITNIAAGQLVQGASTITQQLVRNTMLYRDKTFLRKIKEMILALAVERRLTKDQILDRYLNMLFFGHANYGIEAASRSFFDKPAVSLSWGESSLLASIINAPSRFDIRTPSGLSSALKRRDYVLERLVQDGYISEKQLEEIKSQQISIKDGANAIGQFPFAMFAVQRELNQKYSTLDLNAGGYKIHTSLNLDLLQSSKDIVSKLARINWIKTEKDQEVGFVAMNPKTGGIAAIWGGKDYRKSQYDMAIQAKRPIGPMILPHTISRLLSYGFSLHSRLDATNPFIKAGTNISSQNKSLTLYQILAKQLIYESTPLVIEMGFGSLRSFFSQLNLDTSRQDFDLAWGMAEYSLLELTASYSIYANHGLFTDPYLIDRIYDSNDSLILAKNKKARSKRILDESFSFILNKAISSTVSQNIKNDIMAANFYGGIDLTKQNAWQILWADELLVGIWWGSKSGKEAIPLKKEAINHRMAAVYNFLKGKITKLNKLTIAQPEGVIFRPVEGSAVQVHKNQLFLPEVIASSARLNSQSM